MTGTAGAVATFDVEVASEVVPNDYAVVVNNSDVTEVNGTTYHWKTANEYVWTIEEGAAPVIEGDVTGDGKVNFTDAQSVLTLMANDEYDASADVDHNGKVDFTDYQSILIIMAGE